MAGCTPSTFRWVSSGDQRGSCLAHFHLSLASVFCYRCHSLLWWAPEWVHIFDVWHFTRMIRRISACCFQLARVQQPNRKFYSRTLLSLCGIPPAFPQLHFYSAWLLYSRSEFGIQFATPGKSCGLRLLSSSSRYSRLKNHCWGKPCSHFDTEAYLPEASCFG